MHVTFIQPRMTREKERDALEPLGFAILSALTPCEHTFYDERVEDLPSHLNTDLIAMSVSTFTARRAFQLADRWRAKGALVVMGGHHPTLCPDECLEHADSIVTGDAEDTWPVLLQDVEAGTLKSTYRSAGSQDFTLATDRGVFAGKPYKRMHVSQVTRGCPFACDFCSIHAFYGDSLTSRNLADVEREVTDLNRHVIFADDNLCRNTEQLRHLCAALKRHRITWSSQISLNAVQSDETVAMMAASGCLTVTIGFESMHPENLKQMNKQPNVTTAYVDCVRRLHDHGIMVYGTFVFGYDHDTVDSFQYALDFALQNRLFLANFNPLVPIPGTALYSRLQAERRLLKDPWWLHPDYRYGQACFQPMRMTPEELEEGCYRARTEFNRYSNILRRSLLNRANCRTPKRLGLSLAANWISRGQIHRKQGCTLGLCEAHE